MYNSYKIGHLSDIYNLESPEQIERCIDSLKEGMIAAKKIDAATRAALSDLDVSIQKMFEWPEFVTWTDDNIDTFTFQVKVPDLG